MAKNPPNLHTVEPEGEVIQTTPTGNPADADDINALWTDQGLDDALSTTVLHKIPIGKPKSYFRTHPSPLYRRKVEIYKHKVEGKFEETFYVIDPRMSGRIYGARQHVLITCIYRNGALRLRPIPYPAENETDNDAWSSARIVARNGIEEWVMPVWKGGVFETRKANLGYAPDPDWSTIPPYEELVKLALGTHGRIKNTKHPIYLELEGPGEEGDDPEVDDLAGDDLV
jgi:hypothetical protein